jgi:hypothetical protein
LPESDSAFAALKADGSITSWGNLDNSAIHCITSNSDDAVWIRNLDNSWGREYKHTNAPTDKGYTAIYSNEFVLIGVGTEVCFIRDTNLVVT